LSNKDFRGELVRVRLSNETLEQVSDLQRFYKEKGELASLQRVVAEALALLHSSLLP
jgi:hypothetical protein